MCLLPAIAIKRANASSLTGSPEPPAISAHQIINSHANGNANGWGQEGRFFSHGFFCLKDCQCHLTGGRLSLVCGSLRNRVRVSLRSVRVGHCCPCKLASLPTWLWKLVWPCSQTLRGFLVGGGHLGRTMGRGSFVVLLTEPLGNRWGGFLMRWKTMNKAALQGGPARKVLSCKTSRPRWLKAGPHGGVGKTGRTKGRRGGKRLGSGRGEQMLPNPRSHCGLELV